MDVYKIFDKILNVGLWLFNLCSDLLCLFKPRLRRVLKNNRELKRTHDRCFILGNGPSLNNVDLSLLKNEDTFAVNYFYKHNPNGFESSYLVIIDDKFYQGDSNEYIDLTYREYPRTKLILKYAMYKKDPNKWDLSRTFFIYPKLFQYGDFVQCDCTKNMTACVNVVIQCIQVAISMGYKEIYLLGCDFSQYTQIKPTHFFSDASLDIRAINMGDDARWASLAHYHHYSLYKYARKNGIEIVNLTKESLLDAYPKADLKEVL